MPQRITLEAVNERLKAARIGVRVDKRGDRLSLRATFPPKPGSGKQKPHQQHLSLGIYANPAGLQQAEAEAKVVGGLLAAGRFDWNRYLTVEEKAVSSSVSEWEPIKLKFEQNYFATKGDTAATRLTWKNDYESAFKLLSGDATPESLHTAASATQANTRTRKRTVEKLQACAQFAGIEIDLSPYKGEYGRSSLKAREIPSDELIVEVREILQNPAWQWLYGVMACYGLRDHEAFFCEVSPVSPHSCRILHGKTGERVAYPLHPQWAIEWELWQIQKPNCSGKTYRDYGQRVSHYFNRRNLSFCPYDLRHAYAIRGTTQYKIPIPTMAVWMGHSPVVHLQTYQRWIDAATHEKVFFEAINNLI
ncbi:integrase [Iningainema tapete]|uniref:Integrase n=1 Tax=Iningainema tapete BLCC-T55 TaxID=2748662 RepID=A0A8J6XDB8_9CYAN|nr:integrase [Iningainema tapete]MBD2771218.1 integrase [Iningainema tapete BLCC-T55]